MNADAVLGQQRQRKVRKKSILFCMLIQNQRIFFYIFLMGGSTTSQVFMSARFMTAPLLHPWLSKTSRAQFSASATMGSKRCFRDRNQDSSVWWSKLPMNGLFHGEQTWPAGESLFLTRKNVNMFENGKLLPRFVCFGKDTWIIIGFVSFY